MKRERETSDVWSVWFTVIKPHYCTRVLTQNMYAEYVLGDLEGQPSVSKIRVETVVGMSTGVKETDILFP